MTQPIEKYVARRRFHANLSGANAAFDQPFLNDRIRVFILLPNADFDWPAKLLAQAAFFKRRTNQEWISLPGHHEREDALTGPPANAGVINQRSPGGDVQRFETRLRVRHQLLCASDACLKLF